MHKRNIINGLIKIAEEDTANKKNVGIASPQVPYYIGRGLQAAFGIPDSVKYMMQDVTQAADRVVPFQPIIDRAKEIYINHIPRPEPATQYRYSIDDIDSPDYPIDRNVITSGQYPSTSRVTGIIRLPVNSPSQVGFYQPYIPDKKRIRNGHIRPREYTPNQLGQINAHEERHKYSQDPRKAELAKKLYGKYGIPYNAEEEPALMSEMLYRSYDGRLRAGVLSNGQRAIYPYITKPREIPLPNNGTYGMDIGENPYSDGYLTDIYPPDDPTQPNTNRRFYATPGRYYVDAKGRWADAPYEVADASQLFNGDTAFSMLPQNLQNKTNNMQDGRELRNDRINNEEEWFNLRDQMDVLMKPLADRAPWTQPDSPSQNIKGETIPTGNPGRLDPMPMDLHTVQEKYYLDPSNALPGSSRTIKQMKEDIIPYMQNIYNRQKLIDQNYKPCGPGSAGA